MTSICGRESLQGGYSSRKFNGSLVLSTSSLFSAALVLRVQGAHAPSLESHDPVDGRVNAGNSTVQNTQHRRIAETAYIHSSTRARSCARSMGSCAVTLVRLQDILPRSKAP